jgi:tetratricopeptide (TPR) repeat protein
VDIHSRKILGQNQQTYQRLKVSLSLNLRRQIFVAVCDDLLLRDRLVAQLHTDFIKSKPPSEPLRAGESSAAPTPPIYPRIVSLTLDLNNPNPLAQIADWLRQFPPPVHGSRRALMPVFQLLGIEQLTRQPAAIQRLFFTHLQSIERNLPLLESSLVVWITQPWHRTLPQSAPEFWRCRTGVFEFIGDPTPLPTTSPEPDLSTHFSHQPDRDPPPEAGAPPSLPSLATTPKVSVKARRLNPPRITPSVPAPPPIRAGVAVKTAAEKRRQKATETKALTEQPQPVKDTPSGSGGVPDPIALTQMAEELLPLEQIELLRQQEVSPVMLANAYRTLGNLYRDRIEQGDATPDNIKTAIQAYEHVLPLLQEASPLWVDVLNDLGSLYWMLSRGVSKLETALSHLKRGIQAYQIALTKIQEQPQSATSPLLHNNLGAAYADLARYEDPAENLQQSIQCYEQALLLRRAETEPLRYASTQNNLGTTYWNLAQYQEPADNLKRAIAAYTEALQFYNPEEEPLNYAMIQNNLGTAYWNLAQHESPQEWLKSAVSAYQIALQYRTLSDAPAAFAATQNNLGTAHWHLASHASNTAERLDHLQKAIVAYEETLHAAELLTQQQTRETASANSLNFDLFATHNNLGLAYYQIATDLQAGLDTIAQSDHLEAALRHHVLALQGWEPRSELRQTAMNCVLQTLRVAYEQLGISGQNFAFSVVPGHLLPEILAKL